MSAVPQSEEDTMATSAHGSGKCSTEAKSFIKNRLQSIIYDSRFVSKFAHASFPTLPLIPNERCGPWYVPNNDYAETSYFKSTDGHVNEWQFSMRRLNLHLLPIIGQHGGLISVDSTRRGKLIPDSLSKTIPIWCAVLNSIMYEGDVQSPDHWLRTPVFISKEEHNKIVERIPDMVRDVKKQGIITKERILEGLGGERRPFVAEWHYPVPEQDEQTVWEVQKPGEPAKPVPLVVSDSVAASIEVNGFKEPSACYKIVCLTASLKVKHGESKMHLPTTHWTYIQGSGDDHELWATKDVCNGKLDPRFFWDFVVYTDDGLNPDIIDVQTGYILNSLPETEFVNMLNIVSATASTLDNLKHHLTTIPVKNDLNTTGIVFGTIQGNLDYQAFVQEYPTVKELIVFSDKFRVTGVPEKAKLQYRQIDIDCSKKGAKKLRQVFPQIVPSENPFSAESPLMAVCETGTDISVGLVVLLLCTFYDTDWSSTIPGSHQIDKELVRKHLGMISNLQRVNPSRNTLQSVHEYLMSKD